MMNIWMLTIGSSDVQLKTKANWTKLFRTVRNQLDDRGFTPTDGLEGRFQVPARVMGVVYTQPQAEAAFDDLVFPLIDNFTAQINDKSIQIDKVILVLSDQSVFSKADRSSQHHPYWQDTCTLKPLLEKYLRLQLQENSPHFQLEKPLFLNPASLTEGLDDWDSVLKLIQQEFSSLKFPDNATIFVSHQAGTPAISSAIQFTSLSRFGRQVRFLVSNERDSNLTRVLDSSEYLKGIRKREAETLLIRHDYSGVQALLEPYSDNETQILLEAAIQWNFAKFDEFAAKIKSSSSNQTLVQQVEERSQHWWWTAYESAYLAVVRLKQENTVEAMFHSFRALEGLAIKYVERNGSSGKYGRKAFSSLRHQKRPEWNRHPYIRTLIDLDTPDQERDDLLDKRNNLFHQLQGFHKGDLFDAWIADASDWQEKALGCLNFISGETFVFLDKEGSDGRVASLMVRVHQELETAIAQL